MARHFAVGSSQYLTRAGAALAARPFSIACWAKPTTIVANSCLCAVQENDGLSGGWYLRLDGSTHVRAMDYDGSVVADAISAGSLTVGTWAHVAGTFDTATNFVYLNGVQSTGAAARAKTTIAAPETFVGALHAGPITFFFDGDLAEVAIWNGILTPTEVATLAAGKSAALVRAAALVGYYKILGTASPEPDEKGGTSLTVNGATPAPHPPIDYGTNKGAMFQVF